MFKRESRRSFTRAKELGRPCEDVVLTLAKLGRFAISDGASISYESRRWARSLCWQFIRNTNVGPAWLEIVREKFALGGTAHVDDWAASYACDRGSYATFLGVVVDRSALKVHAIGDSVLFVVTPDAHVRIHPKLVTEDFFGEPLLLCSRPGRGAFNDTESAFDNAKFTEDAPPHGWAGTRLIAMTDALAEWVIRDPDPTVRFKKLEDIGNHNNRQSFDAWVSSNIALGEIKRDDCAVLIIEL